MWSDIVTELSADELKRYDRQIKIRGWGIEGQKKVKKATVGVLGCGGLGSPVTIYLAVAGIGTLVAADLDVVDLSNLNRQILHWNKDVGRKKTESAHEKLSQINPEVKLKFFTGKVDETNVDEVFKGADIVVDALDNFQSRFVLNDFAVRKGIPYVHGSIWGLEGRATTIIPGKTACLRCIVNEAPPKEVFPVLGAAPATIGSIQVTEVLKYLTGVGKLLTGRMIVYDGENMTFKEFETTRDPDCPVCGKL
ncbi:SAMP-activating enzyme E1 [Candidatus Gugararchaeum adminiculabundum]|nr:SAMP-activating enzyme E1 [Candidatus Gugararchaeum adminiculabundum]